MAASGIRRLERRTQEAIERARSHEDEGMTLRERFRRVMHYEKPDRLPNFEFGYWDETLPAWHEQGLPKEITGERKAYEYFGIESHRGSPVNLDLKGPMREEEVLEETDDYRIFRDGVGVTCRQSKRGSSIPHYIDFPLKGPADWEWFRERLQPGGRLPDDFDERVKDINGSDVPVSVGIGSLLGKLRGWMGFEEFAVASIQRRDWLASMVREKTDMIASTLREAVDRGLRPDFGTGWEDICFNNGPIVDVRFFEEVAVPCYKRITDELARAGCDISWTDCDGNILALVPGWLRSGVNCMFPVEVNAGSDPVLMRERFGRELRMVGGVDKMKLAKGKKAIEKELMRLLPVVEDGGFIPHCDHRCPPIVKLDDYKFYLDLKRDLFGAGKKEPRY